MKRKLRAYIAGPISNGDLCENVNRATAAFLALAKAGCAPMCPHWSCFSGPMHEAESDCWPRVYFAFASSQPNELTHADWMGICLEWVDVCDFVVRLPGESKGADMEVARATERGIKVFYTLDSALQYAEVATRTYYDVKAGGR